MKLRVYLDTSVFSAFYDSRVTDRQAETEDFWKRLDHFELSTSKLTRQELSQTLNPDLKSKFGKLLKEISVFSITKEMQNLAQRYVDGGVFTSPMFNDALHVAAAVLTRHDVLLSWNFKHLVNRRRRAMINEMNILQGLPRIEIVAPPEI